jgi:hypothetical protein
LSISSIVLCQLSLYGRRLSFAWKVYSLKKVRECRGNSYVDIDNSKWVVKVQGIECELKTKPVGMTCGLPVYHSQN